MLNTDKRQINKRRKKKQPALMLWNSERKARLREAGSQKFVTGGASPAKQRSSLGLQEGGAVAEGGGGTW